MEDSADEQLAIFTAMVLPVEQWRDGFGKVKEFRRGLKRGYGIDVYTEFHASKFVSGPGHIADRIVTKPQRLRNTTFVVLFRSFCAC